VKKSLLTAALFAMVIVSGGWIKNAEAAKSLPGQVEASVVNMDATVQSIDYGKRKVTLSVKDGSTLTVNVDKSVKNIKKIKKGDLVTVTFFESLAWSVEKPGTQPLSRSNTVTTLTAKKGQMPAVVETDQINIVAKIVKINRHRKVPTVTLQGPQGNNVTVKVPDKKNLKGVKVGDEVAITYTEAVAVSVEKKVKK
jgi:Cu/Ag efflux protein CusF